MKPIYSAPSVKRRVALFGSLCLLIMTSNLLPAQSDTLTSESRKKFHDFLDHFDLTVYMDVYYNVLLGWPAGDTSDLLEFASNCPFKEEFRLNVVSLWFYYNSKNVRGKLELQWGDAPNLLAEPNTQFIKNMKRVEFGFRIYKTLWVDLGYQYNPIGYESSFPIRNQLSTVTVEGYFETGNFLGIKLSSQISPSFYAGVYLGNFYTLAYGKNTRLYGGITFSYMYKDLLSISYSNRMGSHSLATEEPDHIYQTNNIIITLKPVKNLLIAGQVDFGFQSDAGRPPDTTKTASGMSTFLQVSYAFTKWFSATLRGEYLNDPDGATGTLYAYDGKLRGLLTYGGTCGIEFKPYKDLYLRAEYLYLSADKGNEIFCSNLRDYRNTITFTAGFRFGAFR
jgi:hypothetical protein